MLASPKNFKQNFEVPLFSTGLFSLQIGDWQSAIGNHMQPFREILETDRIHVVDGAMGTMLYAKGVYINRCYDELNLSNPDLVREIHQEYIRAGADIIETNTFGATAHKLQQYGLESNLHEINAIAARLAREAAGERAYVAGAIGPLGLRIEPYGPTSFAEARELFKAQAVALL